MSRADGSRRKRRCFDLARCEENAAQTPITPQTPLSLGTGSALSVVLVLGPLKGPGESKLPSFVE
jgi:hypothetical protein